MPSRRLPSDIRTEIEVTQAALRSLQHTWPAGIRFTDISRPSIYDCFPNLFLPAFRRLPDAQVRPFATALRLLANSLFLADTLMDRTRTSFDPTEALLRVQILQFEAYRVFHELFPPSALFWNRFKDYFHEYAGACLTEQRFATDEEWPNFTEEIALRVAIGKSAVAKLAIAGLVDLAADERPLVPLTKSIDEYAVAQQMFDDLSDWKEDILTGIPSLLLTRVCPLRPDFSDPERKDSLLRSIARDIYYHKHLRYVVDLALRALENANATTVDLPTLPWHEVVEELRVSCRLLGEDIDRIVDKNLRRVASQPSFVLAVPPAMTDWEALGYSTLQFIVRQWQLGFGEVRHQMRSPERDAPIETTEVVYFADVFQRALIADALCDADELLGGHLQRVIDYEMAYLSSCRQTWGTGAWSYCPTLPIVAPDADDLGQIMQALLRTGRRREILEHCEKPLSILLRDCTHPDGSFETWIFPAGDRSEIEQRQAEYILQQKGTGPHSEVMANLLYALVLYDAARFADVIRRGMDYLESRQEAHGHWTSKWYFGPFYGTYVCLRLLATARPESPALRRGCDYLRTTQREDGGWGFQAESDPLSTSLVLLGLAAARSPTPTALDFEHADRAMTYLCGAQAQDGSVASAPFILLTYGSRTISTMYVTRAALAWHRLAAEREDKRRPRVAQEMDHRAAQGVPEV